MNPLKVTRKMLKEGIELKAGSYVLQLVGHKLHVRLNVDPENASTINDRFTLIGTKSDIREYEQVRTTKDDVVAGDHFLDLVFSDLIPELNYSLKVDPSDSGEKHYCFEDLPWNQIEQITRCG